MTLGNCRKARNPTYIYIFRCQVQAIAAAMQQRAEQLQLPMPRLVVGQNIARSGRVAGCRRAQATSTAKGRIEPTKTSRCQWSFLWRKLWASLTKIWQRWSLCVFLPWFQISATDLGRLHCALLAARHWFLHASDVWRVAFRQKMVTVVGELSQAVEFSGTRPTCDFCNVSWCRQVM